jgi:hypothetical protein
MKISSALFASLLAACATSQSTANPVSCRSIVNAEMINKCLHKTGTSLPSSVDLSSKKYFPPVINQGELGTCDFCAVVYYQMTYMYNQAYDRAASPSNTFSPLFGYNFLNNAGPYPFNIRVDDVYKFATKHGFATINDVPYDLNYLPWCSDFKIWNKAIGSRIKGYSYFTYNNMSAGADESFATEAAFLNKIKKCLAGGEVLVAQTFPYSAAFGKLSDDPATKADDKFVGQNIIVGEGYSPEHTMAVVGYNDSVWVDLNNDGIVQPNEKGAIKIADSFGTEDTTIQNNGFFWMAYSTVTSSIFECRFNRMIIQPWYQPRIIAKVTLNSAKRDSLRFQFGRSTTATTNGVLAEQVFDPVGFGYTPGTSGVSLIEGGECAFDGGVDQASDGNFTIDLTEIYANNRINWWYLRIDNNSDSPCIIKQFTIIDTRTGQVIRDTNLPQTVTNSEVFRFIK